jgi:hypothetical protein
MTTLINTIPLLAEMGLMASSPLVLLESMMEYQMKPLELRFNGLIHTSFRTYRETDLILFCCAFQT